MGCYQLCGQRMPGSDCADAQSDPGIRCPLTKSMDIVEQIMSADDPDQIGWVELR